MLILRAGRSLVRFALAALVAAALVVAAWGVLYLVLAIAHMR